MGRGRAKAKQTKVARDLKYRTHETDLSALAAELHGGDPGAERAPDPVDDDDDEWADYSESRLRD
ncbi:MAG: DUF3073 domain-containing protein [Oryzihumus sp.]